jgi:hypothetical protein
MSEIDWGSFGAQLGLGSTYSGVEGRRALEVLIGEERVRASVDYYVAARPHYEFARAVLEQLRP